MDEIDSCVINNVKLPPGQQYAILTRGAPKDPVNKRSEIKCEECGKYKSILHLGQEERTIFVCYCLYKGETEVLEFSKEVDELEKKYDTE
jgi:hypothetical protein